MEIKQHFVFEPERPRKALRWFLASTPFLAIGTISWVLGGNKAWEIGTVLAGVLVGFTIFSCFLGYLVGLGVPLGSDLLNVFGLLPVAVIERLEISRRKAIGYLLACWALWAGIGLLFPVIPLKIGSYGTETESPTRIRYLGREILCANDIHDYSFQVRGVFWRNLLKIETHGLCGWVPRGFTVTSGNTVEVEKLTTRTFFVDNRNCEATTIACGDVEFEVAANSALRRTVAAPPGSPSAVRLDGKDIGGVAGPYVLIDTLGTRSYRLREIVYKSALNTPLGGVEPGRLEKPLPTASYRGLHLHALFRAADFFLEEAPKKISIESYWPIREDLIRGELLDEE